MKYIFSSYPIYIYIYIYIYFLSHHNVYVEALLNALFLFQTVVFGFGHIPTDTLLDFLKKLLDFLILTLSFE